MKAEGRGAAETLEYILQSWTKQTSLTTGTWLRSRSSGLTQPGQLPFHGCRLGLHHQASLQVTSGCKSLIDWLLLEFRFSFVFEETDDCRLTLCPRMPWRPGWHDSMSKEAQPLDFFFLFQKLGISKQVRIFLVPHESRLKKLLKWVLQGYNPSHTWRKVLDAGRILGIAPLKHKGPPHSWGRGIQ